MRRKLLEAAVDTMLPPIRFDQSQLANLKKDARGPESKTTIVAFRYAGGIMCVADRKTSQYGYGIFSNKSQKIYQVSHASFLLGCGSVGSIQEVRDYLATVCQSAVRAYGIPLSIQGQAKYTARLCNHIRRYLDGWEFVFGGILAGVSYDGSSHIYVIEEDGSRIDCPEYVAMGSGGENATVALDTLYRRSGGTGMDMDRALRLAIEVMYRAADRDSGSSPVQVMHPTIAVVDYEGVGMMLPDEMVQPMAKAFLMLLDSDGAVRWLDDEPFTPETPASRRRKEQG